MARKANSSSEGDLQPRPKMVPVVDPYSAILANAQSLQSQLHAETDPEKIQSAIRMIDDSLKRIADLQGGVGAVRKALGQQVATVRQAHPKGKPAEGTQRVLPSGKAFIYLDGRWQDFLPPPAQVK